MPRSVCLAVPGSLALLGARTPAVELRHACQAETIVGRRNTDASCAQRPRPSPTSRSPPTMTTRPASTTRPTPSISDQLSGSFLTSSPGSFLASVEDIIAMHLREPAPVPLARPATRGVIRSRSRARISPEIRSLGYLGWARRKTRHSRRHRVVATRTRRHGPRAWRALGRRAAAVEKAGRFGQAAGRGARASQARRAPEASTGRRGYETGTGRGGCHASTGRGTCETSTRRAARRERSADHALGEP
jgi:hypothetical protein